MSMRWKIGPAGPDRQQMSSIAAALRSGKVVLAPTDTIYGLHALALVEESVDHLFEIKARDRGKPLPVLFAGFEQLREAGVILPQRVESALRGIWPAPLTAVLDLERPIPASAGAMSLAARIPAVSWLRQLLAEVGPLASTSANLSGEAPLSNPEDCPANFEESLAGIVDAGPIQRRASTLVDFTSDPPVLLRAGEFLFTQNLWKTLRNSL